MTHPNHLQDSGAGKPQLYLVFCGLYDPPYTPERYARDMTWAGTVKDIADRQFPSLRQVIEIGTGRDVTAQMRAEAGIPITDDPKRRLPDETKSNG